MFGRFFRLLSFYMDIDFYNDHDKLFNLLMINNFGHVINCNNLSLLLLQYCHCETSLLNVNVH